MPSLGPGRVSTHPPVEVISRIASHAGSRVGAGWRAGQRYADPRGPGVGADRWRQLTAPGV